MLINFTYLLEKYNFKPKGIFHIGASHGEEMEEYLKNGIERQIWIEAIPEVFAKLEEKMLPYNMAIPINACISNEIGKKVQFNITDNEGQSSSFLPMGTHTVEHPTVKVVKTIELITTTADTIVEQYGFDVGCYDFLNIDLQGAELLALQGFKNNLKHINYAYIEVNERELYKGCPLVEEIDQFMLKNGFEAIEVGMTTWGWGDKFYMRKTA